MGFKSASPRHKSARHKNSNQRGYSLPQTSPRLNTAREKQRLAKTEIPYPNSQMPFSFPKSYVDAREKLLVSLRVRSGGGGKWCPIYPGRYVGCVILSVESSEPWAECTLSISSISLMARASCSTTVTTLISVFPRSSIAASMLSVLDFISIAVVFTPPLAYMLLWRLVILPETVPWTP